MDRLKVFDLVDAVERRFVRDGAIWTSAGISAGMDMTLAFIAEVAGEKTAGDIQLQTEYYPSTHRYSNHKNYFPSYTEAE